jgi:Na+-translocating ferredoxin:NAD+ oxidoreductase RnfG subunit
VVNAGSPLDKPVAMAILPNGNLIVANTGNNTLVEMTPKGQVLDTKVVDTSKTPGIFGLAAIGTKDGNTALFYTDINTSTLHELEQ